MQRWIRCCQPAPRYEGQGRGRCQSGVPLLTYGVVVGVGSGVGVLGLGVGVAVGVGVGDDTLAVGQPVSPRSLPSVVSLMPTLPLGRGMVRRFLRPSRMPGMARRSATIRSSLTLVVGPMTRRPSTAILIQFVSSGQNLHRCNYVVLMHRRVVSGMVRVPRTMVGSSVCRNRMLDVVPGHSMDYSATRVRAPQLVT